MDLRRIDGCYRLATLRSNKLVVDEETSGLSILAPIRSSKFYRESHDVKRRLASSAGFFERASWSSAGVNVYDRQSVRSTSYQISYTAHCACWESSHDLDPLDAFWVPLLGRAARARLPVSNPLIITTYRRDT